MEDQPLVTIKIYINQEEQVTLGHNYLLDLELHMTTGDKIDNRFSNPTDQGKIPHL